METIKKTQKEKFVIRTRYNFDLQPEDVEHTVGISQTVPDESLTIRELMTKHTTARKITTHEPVYTTDPNFDSDDLEKLKNEDIFDREVRQAELNNEIVAKQKQAESEKAEWKKQQAAKKDAEHEELIKKLEAKTKTRSSEAPKKAGEGSGESVM